MSKAIDEKVVEMRFDNRQFESGVQTSMSTLDKLKQSLKLKDASSGLDAVADSARRLDLSPLSNGVEAVRMKFSALEVMAVTALANITNSAVNAGKRLISSFTIEPIKTGLQEYETQINAVQTILANTESKGSTLKDVNGALDELNTYADKTIYNFTEMTRNIGTFTAAGVDLDTSVAAIKGIANLAAVSGSTSQQASTAMYQLSQALSSGTVKLQDWNSVVNAGMGGQVFQDALKETAKVHGIAIDDMIKDEGSFRETLSKGWLSSEILTETLQKFTGDLTAEQLKSMGYTDQQIEKIIKMGNTANDAATKVKTFTQLMDTLKEAAQSGWTQTWEILIGDFEQAKKLWTSVSDVFGDMINKSADARNKVLQGWADQGGRFMALEAIKNTFNGILDIIKPIKEAFREVFPRTTSVQLVKITQAIRDFTRQFKLSAETAGKIKDTFKGLFSILDLLRKVVVGVGKGFGSLVGTGGVTSFLDMILSATAAMGRFFTSLNEGFDANGFEGIMSSIGKGIGNVVKTISEKLLGSGDLLSSAGKKIKSVLEFIGNAFKSTFGFIKDNVSIGDIFAGLAGGGIFAACTKFIGLINKVKDVISGLFDKDKSEGLKSKVSDILDSLHDSLESFSAGIKVASIVGIAVAVGILASSMRKIAELNVGEIAKSLISIGILMGMLNLSLNSMTKTLKKYNSKGVIKAGASLVLMAYSIKILAGAMEKIGKLSLKEIAKGLIAIGVGLGELVAGAKVLDKVKISLRTSIAILALAEACKMLGDAMQKFSGLSWEEIGHGLVGMGGALGELVAAMSILKKVGGGKSLLGSIGIFIIVQSLSKLADGLKKFGEMSWDEIKHGLVGMGGALAEVSTACAAVGKIAGFSSIFGAGAILIVVQGLDDLAEALKSFGEMTWDEIKTGLTAMGGALGEVSVACGAVGKIAGFSSIFGAGAILIVIQGLDDLANALKKFSEMAWDEIGRGLTAMGGALGEVSIACGAVGKIAGFSAIFGAGAILIVIQGLDDLANALKKFGEMSWDEIGRGLVAMGGALGEVSLFSGALGSISGFSALFGAGAILIVIQGLDDLANALKKFGEMTWDEIGRGLVAMGGALGEVSLFSGALGMIAGFSGLIGAGTILLTVQGLGDLADALKKFGEMSWDEIDRGLVAMGDALAEIALGGIANSLGALGALSISLIAEPLGDLADSVQRWADVTVPDGLGIQLALLADGIEEFTLGGFGAGAIAKVAEPLGTLADSVQKWNGVTLPEGLNEKLTSLADGVKAFSWAWLGGASISVVCEPLGSLADSVKKWHVVKIPEDIGDQLKSLADGVKAFSWAFLGGWSLDAIVGPLKDLADSVKPWNCVKVPADLKDQLTNLADGVKAFSWAFLAGWSLGAITDPLKELAGAVKAWNGVYISSDLTEKLKTFGTVVVEFANDVNAVTYVNVAGISSFANSISTLNTSVKGISGIDPQKIANFVASLKKLDGLKIDTSAISSSTASVSAAVRNMMTTVSNTIKSSQSSISSAMKTSMTGMVTAINTSSGQVVSAATTLINKFVSSVKNKKASVDSAFSSLVSGAATSIKQQYNSFVGAGKYLGEGLVQGISTKQKAAYDAGYALGQKAVQGEKDGQQSHSPSKATIQAGNWLGEGLIIGIKNMGEAVYKAGSNMGEKAISSISGALTNMSDVVNEGMDVSPSIRPVVDMSSLQATNYQLGSNIDTLVAGPVDSWSQKLLRAQSDINDSNNRVISAVNGLRDDLNNLLSTNDQEIALYVDSNKLTSALVNPMNRQLNMISRRGVGL